MDAIYIPIRFQNHALYPKKGQTFSDYEAWTDLLIRSHPTGVVEASFSELAEAWGWHKSSVKRFFAKMTMIEFLLNNEGYVVNRHETWYGLPKQNEENQTAIAQAVIDSFNLVFGKKIQMNDYRKRTILGRMKEGQKMTPKVELKQFTAVFYLKLKTWGEDEKLKQYLTIETLCAKKHFFKYLDEAREAVRATSGASAGIKLSGSITKPINQ